jgi:hypothetical protein
VFLFAFFSPFLTGFIRQNSLSLGHTTRKIEFCPFFKSVKFCSLLVVLSSTKETKKEENFSQEKSLFCSLTHFTRKRKGRKNSSHYYEGRSAFSEAL